MVKIRISDSKKGLQNTVCQFGYKKTDAAFVEVSNSTLDTFVRDDELITGSSVTVGKFIQRQDINRVRKIVKKRAQEYRSKPNLHKFINDVIPSSYTVPPFSNEFKSFLHEVAKCRYRELGFRPKQKKPVTREERRAMYIDKITSSAEEAKKCLMRVGILDESGNLSELYR